MGSSSSKPLSDEDKELVNQRWKYLFGEGINKPIEKEVDEIEKQVQPWDSPTDMMQFYNRYQFTKATGVPSGIFYEQKDRYFNVF